MARMAGPLVAVVLALLLAGCAAAQDDPMPDACLAAPASFVQALAPAPAPVRLDGGTRLSTCVKRARTDSELQALGVSMTTAADTLRDRLAADPGAAAGLGYLLAAVRAGAAGNQGLTVQLRRKVEGATTPAPDAPDAVRSAFARGLRAGASSG